MKNQTHFHYFILEGLFTLETHSLTMLAISIIYLLTLTGNMLIIFVVYHQTSLHTSMYFFITNLSFLEIWYVSLTTPKLLAMLMTQDKRISFQWCFAQLYMFHSLGITECNLLAIMAIDRFVAICKPLRYNAIMNINVCKNLALLCWITGFSLAIIPATLTSRVPFCGNFVKHYFCDLAPLLSLACGDITATVTINSCVGAFFSMFNLSVVIIMYINIIATVAKIKTRKGQLKAFSTCSSHLAVVTLFFGAACIVYAIPKKFHSAENDKMFALVYAMFTPFFNPLIYSLRNKEVISGLKKAFKRIPVVLRL